jgi:hypothetical protein
MPAIDPVIKNNPNGATIPIGLLDATTPGSLKAAPTLAAGDFKRELDGGAAANLTTLPTVTPAGGTTVLVALSQAETNADLIVINCIDQTNPKEWTDVKMIIRTDARFGYGTVTTGASSTSIPTSAFAPAGASLDQFAGRAVLFDNDTTTAALRGCARTISSSSNAALPTFTVTALPATPASGDKFSVV